MGLPRRAALLGSATGLLCPWILSVRAAEGAGITRDSINGYLPELDKLAADALRRTGVPGLSMAVVHQDQAVHLRGFGVRHAGKPELVDADTVFQLASLSKPMASTVVAALAGDELIAWDDPVIRHDPGFAMYDAWVTRQVTLRDMFSHRSGLPDHAGDALEDIGYDRDEVLHRLRHVKPGSSFRSRYAYTNFGLTEAATAAARASGKSWEDLCAGRLYKPLGMTSTSSRLSDFLASSNRASGHSHQDGAWTAKYIRNPDAQSPAGGVSSSARDMAFWLRLQLGRGTVDGREYIKAAALDETHRPHMVSAQAESPGLDQPSFYGLGWGIDYHDGGRVRWSHSGAFNLGAATCVSVLPGERVAIVVLTNTQPIGLPEAVCRSFLDLVVYGEVQRDWLAMFQPLMAKAMAPDYGTSVDYAAPPAQPFPPLPNASYIGAYRSDLYGEIQIGSTQSGLELKLGPRQTPYALRHFDRDFFTYQPVGENAYGPSGVSFALGTDRKAASLTIENLDISDQGSFTRRVS